MRDSLATLTPRIAARADAIEAERRLPADLAAEMAATGLFRMLVPRALGGLQLTPMDAVENIEAVGMADASAGWCTMIAATTALCAAYLPPAQAQLVFGDPDTITGGVFAPMGRAIAESDQWRVSGRWSWASGSANCQWLMGGCVLLDDGRPRLAADGKPDHRMMVMPATDVTLIDTWHAAGLKGTGSGDMAVSDVLVPAERSVSLIHDRPVAEGALYAFPAFGLLALGIAGVASGNARAALNDLAQLMTAKKPLGSARTAAERATVQADVARAEASLSAARALLFEAMHTAWGVAERSGDVPLAERARLRLAATHMVRTSADVTRTAYDMGGGSALFLSSPLQRRFRDAHAMTQHIMVAPATYELVGRVLLGLPTDAQML